MEKLELLQFTNIVWVKVSEKYSKKNIRLQIGADYYIKATDFFKINYGIEICEARIWEDQLILTLADGRIDICKLSQIDKGELKTSVEYTDADSIYGDFSVSLLIFIPYDSLLTEKQAMDILTGEI